MIVLQDPAHSIDLAFEKSLEFFPSNLKDLVLKLNVHFGYSQVKKAQLTRI